MREFEQLTRALRAKALELNRSGAAAVDDTPSLLKKRRRADGEEADGAAAAGLPLLDSTSPWNAQKVQLALWSDAARSMKPKTARK